MKRVLSDLAIFGGPKCFDTPLHVGRPNLGDRATLMGRIEDILDRRWLSNRGQYVQAFEQKVAEVAGTKHAVACCNGTVALEIAVRALGIRGEVILPSFTFIASPHSLQWQEITPVFADIRRSDHTLDPAQIERHITPRTTAIMGVHLWGQPCDTEAIQAIANLHGLTVAYDASHAFGCDADGEAIGGQGNATIFSFHATKFINALEGGAIVTNDDDLAARMRFMKNFGFRGYDDVGYVGTNGKMNEFSAAMGLTNLEAMSDIITINHRNWLLYCEQIEGLQGIRVLPYAPSGRFNYQYVVLEVEPDCAISRDVLLKVLWEEQFLVRKYFWPGCHRMEPYRSLYPNAYLWLPQTEEVANRVLVMPTGQEVTPEIIEAAGAVIRFCVGRGEEVMKQYESLQACGGHAVVSKA